MLDNIPLRRMVLAVVHASFDVQGHHHRSHIDYESTKLLKHHKTLKITAWAGRFPLVASTHNDT